MSGRKRLTYTNENRRRTGKLILLTVGILLLVVIIGAVSMFILLQRNDFDIKKVLGTRTVETQTVPVPENTSNLQAAAVVTASKDSYRYLLLCGDTENGLAFMAEICANINENTIFVRPISGGEALTYNGKTTTVGEMYKEYSYDLVRCYYENSEAAFDKYLSITTPNFKKLMAMLGAVTITIEKDLPYVVDGMTYTFRKGEVSLTSDLLLKYMTATGSGETLLQHQATALCRLLETHFTAAAFTDGESYFSSFISYFKSDINIYDYRNGADAICAFAAAAPTVVSDYLPADSDS